MKKVENVEQEEDQKLTWRAQVLWSHRTWESTILEQVPDDKIVWRSQGDKGYADGAVTFHELAPNLTRVLVTLEYHPKGLFEHVGNLWRAQGRRVRLELKNFQRHVMTDVLLHPDDVEGWRKVISEGEVQDQGKQGGAKGGGQKTGEGGGKGSSTRTRRAPATSRTASGSQRSGGSSQRSGGSSQRSGSTGSSSRTARSSSAGSSSSSSSSSSSGGKSSGSRSGTGSTSGGTKSRQGTSRSRKAGSQ
jgi:hypothetical protein